MRALQSFKTGCSGVSASARHFVDRVLLAGWVSYLLIAALQLKVIWGIWRLRDLTEGDESRYFAFAYHWAQELLTDPLWSPLYTAYYGTIYRLLGNDVYAASILHRVIIVMLAALGVLAVLRMLLPPALALLVAAWWAILPVNFNVLYVVHMFSFLPVLAAAIVAGSGDTPWFRGSALAILVAAAGLARLEFVVAVAAYAIICLWREVHELRSGRNTISWQERATAYGIPLVVVLGIWGIFLWRSLLPLQEFGQYFYDRLTLNMCQGYSVAWHQIHHSDAANECRSVMQTTFGKPNLTLSQMMSFNITATIQYFLWNLSLLPSGLQLALFDHTIGTVNPDFELPRHLGSPLGLVLGVLCILVVLAGGIFIWCHWKTWGANWFLPRQGLWLILLALSCASIPIILAIRPRPAYLYSTTLTLMAIVGTAVYALTPSRLQRYVDSLAPIVVGILIMVPPYYEANPSDRPLYTSFKRLLPFQVQLADSKNRSILGPQLSELTSYLRLDASDNKILDYNIFQSWQTQESLQHFLDRERINVVFLRPDIMRELKKRPEGAQLFDNPVEFGWQKLAPAQSKSAWMLLYRAPLP